MPYQIRMGIPEMEELWDKLQQSYNDGTISNRDEQLYKKWRNALKKLSFNPRYPGLKTHEIPPLTKRLGMRVWESYLENNTSSAMRMFWVYGPRNQEITVIGLDPHPEDKKNGAYDRIKLSDIS